MKNHPNGQTKPKQNFLAKNLSWDICIEPSANLWTIFCKLGHAFKVYVDEKCMVQKVEKIYVNMQIQYCIRTENVFFLFFPSLSYSVVEVRKVLTRNKIFIR